LSLFRSEDAELEFWLKPGHTLGRHGFFACDACTHSMSTNIQIALTIVGRRVFGGAGNNWSFSGQLFFQD
jgi:hypothetical protein